MKTEALDSVQIACPSCRTANRVPTAGLGEAPRCGKCGAALLDGKPVALGEDSFEPFLSRTGMPVLVDFWAPWCGPCRAMAPAFDKVARELATQLRLAKVDTDQAQTLARRNNIRAIPTLILFRNGAEIERISGVLDAPSLAAWAKRHL